MFLIGKSLEALELVRSRRSLLHRFFRAGG